MSNRTLAIWGKILFAHWVSPSTPFFNWKTRSTYRGAWRCSRLSDIPCNPFVLKKEPSQESYYGFEREISGNSFHKTKEYVFLVGTGLGRCCLPEKKIWASVILLTYRTVRPGTPYPGEGSPSQLKKKKKKKWGKNKTQTVLWEVSLAPSRLLCSYNLLIKWVFFSQQLCSGLHNLPSLFILVSAVGPGAMRGLGVPKNLHVNLVSPKLNY